MCPFFDLAPHFLDASYVPVYTEEAYVFKKLLSWYKLFSYIKIQKGAWSTVWDVCKQIIYHENTAACYQ